MLLVLSTSNLTFFFLFFWPRPRHVEVSRPGMGLAVAAYIAGVTTQDP